MKTDMGSRSAPFREPSAASRGPAVPLVMSYVLALATPWFVHAIQATPGLGAQHHGLPRWVPVVMALGVGLGGTAALVCVMRQLVESLPKAPYAALASALSVLLGVVLMGLNASLRVGLLNAHALAFLCLTVSVMGGALVVQSRGRPAAAWVALCLSPAALLLLCVWAPRAWPHAGETVQPLGPANQAYLALLTLGCILLSVVALLVRTLRHAHRGVPLRMRDTRDSGSFRLSLLAPSSRSFALPLLTARDRARISAALRLAISDCDKRGAPLTPPNFSVWTYHDQPTSETPWDVLDAIACAEMSKRKTAPEQEPELITKLSSHAMFAWIVLIGAGLVLASAWVLTQGILEKPAMRALQGKRVELLSQGVRAQASEP